jgi:cytidine deaminase
MRRAPRKLDPAEEARHAAARAHAPYSGFRVGAILEDATGGLHAGCNVECASIGLSVCAERTALGRAITRGARNFRRIWIYTPTAAPTPPCGACRQMLAEFAPGIEVLLLCDRGPARRVSLARLLPGSTRRGRSQS